VADLRRWQTEALRLWTQRRKGTVHVVTGGGKTRFALACIAERDRGQRVLIIVPSVALMDQWALELVEHLRVDPDQIAIHGGGRKSDSSAPFHIAVVNTARRLTQTLTEDGSWMLVADECHRYGAPENRRAINGRFDAALGLSATPHREYDDWFDEHVARVTGPVIYSYGYSDAVRDKVLVPFELHNFEIPLTSTERDQIDTLDKRLARLLAMGHSFEDEEVKMVLLRRSRASQNAAARIPAAVALVDRYRTTRSLVFHESINGATQIDEALRQGRHRTVLYHSGLGQSTRLKHLLMFRSKQADVIVTCRALDEGIDVPDARLGIIAASTSSTRQRIQRLGRVLRVAPGKDGATICTLFALDTERERLEAEADGLEGVAAVRWFRAVVS
jgi:superfamily II DNA or RNA helicase